MEVGKGETRPIVNNVSSGVNLKDKLITSRTLGPLSCQVGKCGGSLMGAYGLARKNISGTNQIIQAREFLLEYFKENNREKDFDARWAKVSEEISEEGHYELTEDELIFGARTAWRNAPRCSGRSQWKNLVIRDCRKITTVEDMFKEICIHIKESSNNGIIIPMISVFPERQPNGKDIVRIWNGQLISYAAYAIDDPYATDDPKIIIGDRSNLQFTQFCETLGWKGKGGRFDILPLVLSGFDGNPVYFEIPDELIMRVKIKHPTLPEFEKLNLEWYGLPAVSGMLMEVGGIQFPTCPFSGWYALSEIATRDLLDPHRYNILNEVASALGYDTSVKNNLWQDRVNTEVNLAVLHSYNSAGVAIVDHHTLSEQFMTHFTQEHKIRGGCPADWVWVVPPVSSGLCMTFHQEMRNYHLSPSYEYQEPPWKKFKLSKAKRSVNGIGKGLWFMSSLYQKRYRARNRAYVFYGTMTGTSKMYASTFTKCLDQLFQTQIMPLGGDSMEFMQNLNKEGSVVYILTSTTGNGNPPHHAIAFRSCLEDALKEGKKPLNGLKYAVFALGSSTYENFCTFGKFCDTSLEEIGGMRIAPLVLGDEQKGQDRAFRTWAMTAFKNACDSINIHMPKYVEEKWPFAKLKSRRASMATHSFKTTSHVKDMKKFHGAALDDIQLLSSVIVAKQKMSDRYHLVTIGFKACAWLKLKPGDHICIFPENDPGLVNEVMKYLSTLPVENEIVVWNECEVPPSTLRRALTSYLDLTSTPSRDVIHDWVQYTSEDSEAEAMEKLSEDTEAYMEFKSKGPDVSDLLHMFPSLRIPAASFVASLNKLTSRAYSVASIEPTSTLVGGQNIPITDLLIEMVEYETGIKENDGSLKRRKGVCTSFLSRLPVGGQFLSYHHSNAMFKMPDDPNVPILMVSAGSGIAPFRSFWQQRMLLHWPRSTAFLYHGCRNRSENMFEDETSKIVQRHVAMSRVGDTKQYVQDLLLKDQTFVYDVIANRKGQIYLCGKVAMALDVKATLIKILIDIGGETAEQAKDTIHQLQRYGRLMEEYFG